MFEQTPRLLIFVFACAIFAIDLLLPPQVVVPILYAVPLSLCLGSKRPSAVFPALLLSLTLSAAAFFAQAGSRIDARSAANLVLTAVALSSLAVLIYHRNGDQRMQVKFLGDRVRSLERVKVLRGMLPICPACKKIRSPRDEWLPVENYVEENSEAHFGHELCPDCTLRIYPPEIARKVIGQRS